MPSPDPLHLPRLLTSTQTFSSVFPLIPSFTSKITSLQIPRHTRQSHHQPIQLLIHLNLTPQSTRLRESERQIQHIVLVIIGFLHLVIHVGVLDNDVACAAGAGAAARAFHFYVVGERDVEEVVAV